jgi:short subunit dehydrogenase-like uncharacterized protein
MAKQPAEKKPAVKKAAVRKPVAKKPAVKKTAPKQPAAQTPATKKQYDIVLFGATGFTGELTAEYLARAMLSEKFTWAIAGRSESKLEKVKQKLQAINPDCESQVDLLVADIEDQASLNTMADRAKVVITTVGPYILYGEKVVQACVEHGADYVDLTGEPEFVELIINRYHRQAEAQGVRIVNCCGFDSIPHDLGAYYTVQQLTRDMTPGKSHSRTSRLKALSVPVARSPVVPGIQRFMPSAGLQPLTR